MQTDCSELLDKYKDILLLLNGLNEKERAKLVGGCVRDFLLTKKISNDVDISTILQPKEVVEILDKYRLNADKKYIILDKDISYGTIVVIIDDVRYEITTTRSDIACFGREAKVEFCQDFQNDSNRRDFTINALYLGLDGKILDFHDGLNDLKNGVIRFIGNPKQRIEEDFLRIIRFFRFATKFNFFAFDSDIIETIKLTKYGLKHISRERIRSEIFKLLEYDNWFLGLKKIVENGLSEEIFCQKDVKINNESANFVCDKIVELFYFFNFDVAILNSFKQSFKFTKDEMKFTDFLTSFWELSNGGKDFNIDAKMLIFHAKNEFIKDIFHILDKKIANQLEIFLSKQKLLKITANELMKLGYSGKDLGDKISKLEKKWVRSDFQLSNEELLKD